MTSGEASSILEIKMILLSLEEAQKVEGESPAQDSTAGQGGGCH